MNNIILKRSQNALVIEVGNIDSRVISTFTGTAANEDSDFLQSVLVEIQQLCEQTKSNLLVFDVTKLDFCYSSCVKVLMSFSTDCSCRPHLEYIISKNMWQVTSLRAMVNMSPNCTLVNGSSISCSHSETRSEDEQHFAPTGKGVITTTVFCKQCGLELSKSTEYFD